MGPKSKTLLIVMALALAACGLPQQKPSPSITVGIEQPYTRVNGDPLKVSDLYAYKLYISTDASFATTTVYTLGNIDQSVEDYIIYLSEGERGLHYFAYATAVDLFHQESDRSNVIEKTIQ